jgi:hypothetical protein
LNTKPYSQFESVKIFNEDVRRTQAVSNDKIERVHHIPTGRTVLDQTKLLCKNWTETGQLLEERETEQKEF